MDLIIKRLKIIIIGDAYIGKSTLVTKYCDRSFLSKYVPTADVNYWVANADVLQCNFLIDILDMSGNPTFFKVRSQFYPGTQGVLLMYDVTNKKSFESLSWWLDEIYQQMKLTEYYRCTIIVCGNKIDLKSKREVSSSTAYYWANERGLPYFEITVRDDTQVDDVFAKLFRYILQSEELWNDSKYISRPVPHACSVNSVVALNKPSTTIAISEMVWRLFNGSDDYEKIGLTTGASRPQVNQAFRQLAILLHPDKNKSAGAEDAFKQLTKIRLQLLKHLD